MLLIRFRWLLVIHGLGNTTKGADRREASRPGKVVDCADCVVTILGGMRDVVQPCTPQRVVRLRAVASCSRLYRVRFFAYSI